MSEQNDAPERTEPARLRQSESVAELAAALAVAQGQVEDAVKDSANPHFKSKYADLASVWRACREALTANGLSVVQSPAYVRGHAVVTTRLLHASGQWLEGTLAIPVGKTDAHGVGSATTYGRRYALAAMVGVAPDDDDGNLAVAARQTSRDRAMSRPAAPVAAANGKGAAMAAARAAVPGKLRTADTLPDRHARGDDHDWRQWTSPPPNVEAGENPEWYCQAVKGLLYHCEAKSVSNARTLLEWLVGEPVDPAAVKSDPAVAKDFWGQLVARSHGVPFERMLAEASKRSVT